MSDNVFGKDSIRYKLKLLSYDKRGTMSILSVGKRYSPGPRRKSWVFDGGDLVYRFYDGEISPIADSKFEMKTLLTFAKSISVEHLYNNIIKISESILKNERR